MAITSTSEPLRFRAPFIAAKTPTPIKELQEKLKQCQYVIDCWPTRDQVGSDQTINVFSDHTSWFAETKRRILEKGWHPDQLRVLTADAPTALRLAAWIRQAQLGKRKNLWCRGEFVRSLDAHHQQGQQVSAAGADCRVLTARAMKLSEDLGLMQWATPGGKPRELQLSISGVDVMAVKLEPLAGGEAITVMAEPPGRDSWRQACRALVKGIEGCRHDAATYAAGRDRIRQLEQLVMRLRPACTIPAELVAGRQFQAAALHPDLAEQGLDGILLTQLAVAAAAEELLVVRQKEL
jgi:hypothetical protein